MKENYCSTCGQEFKANELTVRCSLCMRNYHASCWEKTGGCTTYGCPGKPSLKDDEENSLTYKRCPYCGEKIISFAVKCRYCRSMLVVPESSEDETSHKNSRHDGHVRKDPILAGLLNLIFPGAGYMYLGFFSKGLFWFLVAVAAWFFTRGLGLIAVYLWVIYDSSRQAVELNREGENISRRKAQRF